MFPRILESAGRPFLVLRASPEFLAIVAYIQILPARPTRELVNRPDARHLYLNAFSDRVATRPLDSYHIYGAYVGIR